jgi:hypothetical protein
VTEKPSSSLAAADSSERMRAAFAQFMEQLQPLRTLHMSQSYIGSPEYPGVILLFLAAPDPVIEPLKAELDAVVKRVLSEHHMQVIEPKGTQ